MKQANEKIRQEIMQDIKDLITEKDLDCLQVASQKFAVPFVNEKGGEGWLEITFALPKGSRDDADGYDGFSRADEFEKKNKERAEKKAEQERKKQAKIKSDQKRREQMQKNKRKG